MKVLFINNFYTNFGGAEKVAIDEAKLLENNGHEVFFFATNRPPLFDEDYKYKKYFPEFSNYRSISKFSAFRKSLKVLYNFEAEKKLDLLIKETNPDIVHLHNNYYHLSPSIINACKKNKIPVVMTLHDSRLFCPSATLRFKDEKYCTNTYCLNNNPLHCLINQCKEKSFSKSFIVTLEFLFRRLHKLYDYVDTFICPSDSLRQLLIKSGVDESRTCLLTNFLPDLLLKQKPVYENSNYFLYVGRLSRAKGLDLLIKAMEVIPEIKLHIVGTGEDEDYLKSLAESINISNIEFKGFKEGSELQEEFENCIATILPSNWFENAPLSVLESFSFGKALLTSDVGGLPELVEDNVTGKVFSAGSISEIAQALTFSANNLDLIKQMGKNARFKAETEYNQTLHYQKLLQIYNKVLMPN